jgi:putative ABC transport system permease protein
MLMQIGPRVDFAALVGFGDYTDGHPVVGTTSKLIVALSPAFDQGTTFASLGDAVIGADVPKRIGAEIKPMHGSAEPEGHEHKAHVSVDAAIDEHFDVETPGIPAVLVKPKTIADAYRLRQEYRGEATLAVFPAEVLTRLYATLGDARGLLLAIAIGTQIIVIAAVLLVTIMHVGARQRQIGALRAFGAPRRAVVAIVWGELFLLFLAGFAAGLVIGYGTAHLISATLTATTAIRMPVEFAREDPSLAFWFVGLAVLVSILPALSTLRLSPARALRS